MKVENVAITDILPAFSKLKTRAWLQYQLMPCTTESIILIREAGRSLSGRDEMLASLIGEQKD